MKELNDKQNVELCDTIGEMLVTELDTTAVKSKVQKLVTDYVKKNKLDADPKNLVQQTPLARTGAAQEIDQCLYFQWLGNEIASRLTSSLAQLDDGFSLSVPLKLLSCLAVS